MTCCICQIPINKSWNRNHCIQCYYKKKLLKQKKKQDEIKRKKPEKNIICYTCQRPFTSKYKVEKFCSTECRINLSNRKANEQWAKETTPVRKEKSEKSLIQKERKTSFNKFPVNLPRETYKED